MVIFLLSALLLAFGYYLEWQQGIVPCSLCYVQRVVFMILLLISLIAAIHHTHKKGQLIYLALLIVSALTGAGIAAWQVWLQASNGSNTACLPNIGPLGEWLESSGGCGEISWQFWGVSIPGWSLLCFMLIAVLAIWRFTSVKTL